MPGGNTTLSLPRVWSASGRVSVIVNVLYAPAWTFVVPASNPGWNGRGVAHGVPSGPLVIWKAEVGATAGVPDHGSKDVAVVYAPHDDGVLSGALAVPKNDSFT